MYDRKLGLAATLVTRSQERTVDQRSEERHDEVVERAIITFRGQEYLVPVVNISSRGTMIESGIDPRIGETISIQFENCTRIQAFVRWIREGRIGLNFGHEIVLGL
ncbi:PilZ domain-containing protein [Sphingomonas sp. LY54]|uniref:PilZ domain-containing protein n=1 Tax=Sphingomonadales TaxID=204457 RepID=UPI002ADEB265|nr:MULTISPECIES: PilZ domain-containing protein [Sphingomonadales]MEA1014005.1 PilZ domain-containing protein [Sphingosinicella sp. LY1275]WRP30113.1 PilZ domain-containing protein [Sphingomonas sp. LY54]